MRSADSTRTVKGAKRRAKRCINRFILVLSGYGAKAHPKTRHAGRWAVLLDTGGDGINEGICGGDLVLDAFYVIVDIER